ncbi:MAG TPA: hypothetical protein VIK50_02020 [Gemmatimonadaceae bacterium]
MTSKRQKFLALAALALLPAGLAAQDTVRTSRRDSSQRWVQLGIEPKRRGPAEQDPAHAFEQYLFPPELVMQHQARLKITEAQRNFIVGEITKLQATAVQVQWRVGDESEKLAELLQRETVAEADVLAQADRMIMYETAVKRAQLSMLIRIRNMLTPEQRQMLQELRKFSRE